MNLEKIQEMWEVDSVINEFDLDTESLKIPQLHQKYYKLYTEFKFILKESTNITVVRHQKKNTKINHLISNY
jgi:hypothetical protein